MLQDNVEGYRREITSLQERTQKLTATTQKQEQIINTMTQDLRGANEKLAMAEVIHTIFSVTFACILYSYTLQS